MHTKIYKGNKIISTPKVAHTVFQKAKGLMFSKQRDLLFIFKTEERLNFHMVFVFYPIDIIFINHNFEVVDFKKSFKPFTFYYSKKKALYALEVKEGFIDENNIKIGDILFIGEKSKSVSRKNKSRNSKNSSKVKKKDSKNNKSSKKRKVKGKSRVRK